MEIAPGVLRDLFAMLALSGLLSNSNVQGTKEEIVKWSYAYADEMMSQREQKPS